MTRPGGGAARAEGVSEHRGGPPARRSPRARGPTPVRRPSRRPHQRARLFARAIRCDQNASTGAFSGALSTRRRSPRSRARELEPSTGKRRWCSAAVGLRHRQSRSGFPAPLATSRAKLQSGPRGELDRTCRRVAAVLSAHARGEPGGHARVLRPHLPLRACSSARPCCATARPLHDRDPHDLPPGGDERRRDRARDVTRSPGRPRQPSRLRGDLSPTAVREGRGGSRRHQRAHHRAARRPSATACDAAARHAAPHGGFRAERDWFVAAASRARASNGDSRPCRRAAPC